MKYLLYIALCFGLLSCERLLTIQVPELQEKLVVNAFADPSQKLELNLGKNSALLDEPYLHALLGQTRLILSEDGFVIHDRTYDVWNGLLKTNVNLSKGKDYEIYLQAEGFPIIHAVDHMPEWDPNFKFSSINPFGNLYRLQVRLLDYPGPQFYMMELYMKGYTETNGDTTWSVRPLDFTSSDKLFISNINTVRSNSHFALFDDQLLGAGERELQLSFKGDGSQWSDDFIPHSVQLQLKILSQDFFNYYIEILENNHIYGGPLASPTFSGGNIEGGLGIFGCYTLTEKSIKLP